MRRRQCLHEIARNEQRLAALRGNLWVHVTELRHELRDWLTPVRLLVLGVGGGVMVQRLLGGNSTRRLFRSWTALMTAAAPISAWVFRADDRGGGDRMGVR